MTTGYTDKLTRDQQLTCDLIKALNRVATAVEKLTPPAETRYIGKPGMVYTVEAYQKLLDGESDKEP